jgi:hypothetical protein
MSGRWTKVGSRYAIDWGGRAWNVVVDADHPGLTSADGRIGPMLALDGVSARGRSGPDVLGGASLIHHELHLDRIEAVYAPEGWDTLRVRAAWTAVTPEMIDLEVQIQAFSVDRLMDVEIHVASHVGSADVGTSSYLEFVHPDDRSPNERPPRSGWTRHSLFGHDLEKGVVLRGRLRGIWLADASDAASQLDRFLHEPLPLGP